MFKRILLVTVLILTLASMVGYWWQFDRISVKEFQGVIVRTESDAIIVKGHYTAEGHPEFQNPDQEYEVRVRITPETIIQQVAIQLPTLAEVQANGGTYRLEDQPQELRPGSLDEVGPSTVIAIMTTGNIYHRTALTAETILYNSFLYPLE